MKKVHVLICCAMLLTSQSAVADSPRLWFANDGGLLSLDYITDGKQKVMPGIFFHFDVEPLVKDMPEALSHVQES